MIIARYVLVFLAFLITTNTCYAKTKAASFLLERPHVNVSEWRFHKGDRYGAQFSDFDDAMWDNVNVPHTWSHDAISEHGYYQGVGWYRTNIHGSLFDQKQRIFIRFEGVGQDAVLFLNGVRIGVHRGGYSAFTFELTSNWNWNNNNLLAVKAENKTQFTTIPVSSFLFNNYGGIYRPATLFSTPDAAISPLDHGSSGIYLDTKSITDKKALVDVRTHLSVNGDAQNYTLKHTVYDQDNHTVFTQTKTLRTVSDTVINTTLSIPEPTRWHGVKNPYLYRLKTELTNNDTSDAVMQTFGLREIKFDANKGFLLNGEHYPIRGVCRHQEWQAEAAALTDEHHRHDMELIEEMGANGIRLAHYQQAETIYQLADEFGMVVWAEIPFVHTWSGREGNNAKSQLTELILQNYNHPSIITWGLWNEVRAFKAESPAVALTNQLNILAHKLDPSRPTTSASDRKATFTPMEFISDTQGWNLYFGWYGGDPYEYIGTWLDETHAKKPEVKIAVSEYGYGANIAHQNMQKSEKPLGDYFPEHEQAIAHEKAWEAIKTREFVWGSFIWSMFDFSVNSWARGGIDHMNHKGLITFDRKTKKDAFYFYKSAWSNEPTLYIAQHRHTQRKTRNVDVKVYTNLPEVTLILNGKHVKKKVREDLDSNIVLFSNIQLDKGENDIRVEAVSGQETLHHSAQWIYHSSQ